jgi:hypothetical protein
MLHSLTYSQCHEIICKQKYLEMNARKQARSIFYEHGPNKDVALLSFMGHETIKRPPFYVQNKITPAECTSELSHIYGCVSVDWCPEPPTVHGGSVKSSGRRAGSTATYTCQNGYIMSGQPVRNYQRTQLSVHMVTCNEYVLKSLHASVWSLKRAGASHHSL